MLRHRTTAFVCVCLAVVSAACNDGPKPATRGSAAPVPERPDARVRSLADAYLDGYLQRNPGQVTFFGGPEAREEARQALGPTFDITQFDDRVLEDGAIPVSSLHQKIKAWAAK
jgi:hypothetical protein